MEFKAKQRVILASGSPRRKELLELLGIPFDVVVSNVKEDEISPELDRAVYARTLAYNKAYAVAEQNTDAVVIGADTIVVLGEYIFPKPRNEHEAKEFLQQLSGQTHTVVTGVAIIVRGETYLFADETDVTFYELDDDLINMYIATGDPMDKAGAYGIQSGGALFVQSIDGDFYSVMGLPISALTKHLRKLGIISVQGGDA